MKVIKIHFENNFRMATSKDSGGGLVHECFCKCESKKHASNLIAAVLKSNLSDEKVTAYLKWACVKYPYAVDSYGRTMVHAAALKGRLQLLKFLLTHRDININVKDQESSYSPLHCSLYYGQLHCAVRLIQAGANLQQTDLDDLMPLDHVMKDRPSILTYDTNQPCEVYIWGVNTNYTLGIGHNHSRSNPDLLDYFRKENITIKQAFMSKFHSLFLGSNGRVWTCGLGSGGRLGLGDEATTLVPKVVRLGSSSEPCIKASIGIDHSVLLMKNGTVWSFGLNTYHQLGHSPPPEKLLFPKVVKALKSLNIIGVSASKFHTAFWTQNQILTCGLHGGQLGHLKTNDNTISVPKVVPKLDLKSSTVKHVATSDGATVVVSSKGDIFLFYEYQCKKLTSKNSKFDTKRICISGGHLDHRVYTSCLQEKGGEELKIVILTTSNRIYLWQETFPQVTRCLLSLRRYIVITDMALNRVSLLLTTSDGEAFEGEIKTKKRKTLLENEKPPSPKSKFATFVSKEDCNYVKLKRIPHIHRAVNVACDLKGRNFAVVQVHPKSGLLQLPLVETSEMKENMKSLMTSADEFDTLHDVIFEVGGMRFPAHRYVVSHSCLVIEDLINKSEIVDDVCYVKIDNVQPQIFQRILSYLYTGECDLLKIGRCPLSLDFMVCDKEEPAKQEPQKNANMSNPEEISAFEYYKQQRLSKRKNESKGKDPLKSLCDAARIFEIVSLLKILEAFRYENGYICKCDDKNIELRQPTFDRKHLQNLWDINLESENGEIIEAHKCILVARMEYFNCMINQGWLESSLKTPLKLPIPGSVLEILIRFLYTDEAPELLNSDDPDLASHVLVISDQYFCTKLKEIAEASLGNMINLKNASEMLQLAVTYNASQLKRCAMEFICLNLSAILEAQTLEILDDSLLTDLKNFYRSWLPCMSYRNISSYVKFEDDKFIEAVYNAEPVSFEKVEEELTVKPNLKTRKKKSHREKKVSESETQRVRNRSIGYVTSDEELGNSLDYPEVHALDDNEAKESAWIMVTSHSNKQQRGSQVKPKFAIPGGSKALITNTLKPPNVPLIPTQKLNPVPLKRLNSKIESLNDIDRDGLFLSTASEKEFPALSVSSLERIRTITPKSPSESTKKFVKLSQKQRKRIALQSKSEDEESIKKPIETLKPVWGILKCESQSLTDIMKEEIKSSQQNSPPASSPPWQGPSSPTCSLAAIMAAERQQRDLLSKIKSKPLEYTQMEDKAIDDLLLLYDTLNVTDERITVRRADPIFYSPPVWVSSHR